MMLGTGVGGRRHDDADRAAAPDGAPDGGAGACRMIVPGLKSPFSSSETPPSCSPASRSSVVALSRPWRRTSGAFLGSARHHERDGAVARPPRPRPSGPGRSPGPNRRRRSTRWSRPPRTRRPYLAGGGNPLVAHDVGHGSRPGPPLRAGRATSCRPRAACSPPLGVVPTAMPGATSASVTVRWSTSRLSARVSAACAAGWPATGGIVTAFASPSPTARTRPRRARPAREGGDQQRPAPSARRLLGRRRADAARRRAPSPGYGSCRPRRPPHDAVAARPVDRGARLVEGPAQLGGRPGDEVGEGRTTSSSGRARSSISLGGCGGSETCFIATATGGPPSKGPGLSIS